MRQIIKIKNCNCISEANISIQEGELNIKYGPNGTGKSSISEAIFAASQGNAERLGKLKPYSAQEGEKPAVESLNFSKVRVFDENYIQGYLLKGDMFFEDSFQVFLKSDECDALTQEINTLLSALQGMFRRLATEGIADPVSSLPGTVCWLVSEKGFQGQDYGN